MEGLGFLDADSLAEIEAGLASFVYSMQQTPYILWVWVWNKLELQKSPTKIYNYQIQTQMWDKILCLEHLELSVWVV